MTFRFKGLTTAAMLVGAFVAGPALAGDITYTPVNPSFGGSPLNSSHLLGLANAQRTATASDARSSSGSGGTGGGTGGTPGRTDADLFVQQLQGRLLSALAGQVTDAIFGENPQDHGTVEFGDTTVEFIRSLDSITLIITDATGVTKIVVPQLVTSTDSSTLAAESSFAPAPLAATGNFGGQGSLNSGLDSSSGDLIATGGIN